MELHKLKHVALSCLCEKEYFLYQFGLRICSDNVLKLRDSCQSQLLWQEWENWGRLTPLKSPFVSGMWNPRSPRMAEVIFAAFCFLIALQIAQQDPWTTATKGKNLLQEKNHASFLDKYFKLKVCKQFYTGVLHWENSGKQLRFQIGKECVHLSDTTPLSNRPQAVT